MLCTSGIEGNVLISEEQWSGSCGKLWTQICFCALQYSCVPKDVCVFIIRLTYTNAWEALQLCEVHNFTASHTRILSVLQVTCNMATTCSSFCVLLKRKLFIIVWDWLCTFPLLKRADILIRIIYRMAGKFGGNLIWQIGLQFHLANFNLGVLFLQAMMSYVIVTRCIRNLNGLPSSNVRSRCQSANMEAELCIENCGLRTSRFQADMDTRVWVKNYHVSEKVITTRTHTL